MSTAWALGPCSNALLRYAGRLMTSSASDTADQITYLPQGGGPLERLDERGLPMMIGDF